MKVFVFLLFLCMAQHSFAAQRPSLYGHNHTDNYVRYISPTKDFTIEPQWPDVLKRQPIKAGKGKITYNDLVAIQAECNRFNWAHEDEVFYTPKEAQAKGWGDCKDAAICKYYKLRELGAKSEQLNLWQGWFLKEGLLGKDYIGHLTLAVRIGDEQYVLDNNFPGIMKANDFMRKHFEPYARFNEVGWDLD